MQGEEGGAREREGREGEGKNGRKGERGRERETKKVGEKVRGEGEMELR